MIVSTLSPGFEISSTIEPKAEDLNPCKSQSFDKESKHRLWPPGLCTRTLELHR